MTKLPKFLHSFVLLFLSTVIVAALFGQSAFIVSLQNQVEARSSQEVAAEIEAQKQQLNGLNSQIAAAQKELNAAKAQLGGANSQIAQLQAQINEAQAEIKLNQLKLESLTSEKQLQTLEKQNIELQRSELLRSSYTSWRSVNQINSGGLGWVGGGVAANVKLEAYRSSLLGVTNQDLTFVTEKITDISSNINQTNLLVAELDKQSKDLVAKKAQLEAEIALLQRNVNASSGAVSGLRTQAGSLQRNINQLSAEQRALQEYENALLSQGGNGGQQTIAAGEYYFFGRGRDLYQGHGVGLSQFGAFGAAQRGWNAEQIIKFYYTNVRLETRPGNVNVQGYGTMSADVYVAGLGEVPDRACGTPEQIAARPDKYISDNPNTIWDCWPEESIKAQVIAARTYALFQGGTICTNANCQIYKGGTAKMWAAEETSNQVIISNGGTHAGGLISAVYSSDNNQGGGTAHNDTVFSTMAGDGTPHSYLRAVNDTNVARLTSYSSWQWRTDGFDMAKMARFLNHGANHGGLSSSARNYMSNLRSAIGGEVAFLGFEKDPSGRVKKVILTGTNGQSRSMAGWFFKTIWNSWVATERPNGSVDYIYSLTFTLAKSQ